MGTEIAERTAASLLGVKAPNKFQVRRSGPILQVARPEVVDLTDTAILDHPLCKRYRWDSPIVVHHEMAHARRFHGRQHLLGFVQSVGEWLLADNMLACPSGSHRHSAMHMARRNDVDDVDIVARHDGLPVGGGLLPAEGITCLLGLVRVAPANYDLLQPRSVREIHVDIAIALAVGLAHELGAEQRHAVAGSGCGCLILRFQATLSNCFD